MKKHEPDRPLGAATRQTRWVIERVIGGLDQPVCLAGPLLVDTDAAVSGYVSAFECRGIFFDNEYEASIVLCSADGDTMTSEADCVLHWQAGQWVRSSRSGARSGLGDALLRLRQRLLQAASP